MKPSRVIGLLLMGVAGLTVLMFALATYYTVEPNQRAIVTRWGAIVSIESEGLHFKAPIVNEAHFVRIDIQEIAPKKRVNTYTIDNQEVDVNFNLFYRLDTNRLEFIWRNVQDYKARLEAMTIDRLKAEMGKINVAHVAEKRGELRDKIKAVVTRDAESLGIIITDFQLTDLEYTASYKQAVEAAASAKANIETKENERLQAEKIADTVRTRAKGEADAFLLQRKAEAEAIELKGKAEAAAIKAQADALAANVQLVELRKAERWNGELPKQMLGGSPIPFINIDAKK